MILKIETTNGQCTHLFGRKEKKSFLLNISCAEILEETATKGKKEKVSSHRARNNNRSTQVHKVCSVANGDGNGDSDGYRAQCIQCMLNMLMK